MIDKETLSREAAKQGVVLSPEALEQMALYARRLVEWNEKMNLTAITDPDGILYKHFLDSLTLAPQLPEGASLIDVGTGAGFPGVPLALARPDLRLTLLDSLHKRLVFLEALCEELSVPVQLIHARAEDAGRRDGLRESFDVATARAVASLPVLCEYCLPFVKVGGRFIAMKGPDGRQELEKAQKAAALLGGRPAEPAAFLLPAAGERLLLSFEKIAPTPSSYPRPSAKMAKQPL